MWFYLTLSIRIVYLCIHRVYHRADALQAGINMNDPAALSDPTTRKLSDYFTKEEITGLAQRSDLHGALAILGNWGLVAAAFTLVARAPGPVTVAAALCVIAGRQLG